jgi:lipoate-protein ligase A
MGRSGAWRLILDPPSPPAWNMALDEALLEAWRPGDPPVLRLYGWRPAALSLGRFQAARELVCPPGAVLVRRITGGSAIHHREDEVTYALVAPYGLFETPRPRAAYRAVHGALARALASLGVAAPDPDQAADRAPGAAPRGMCFATATGEDLLVGGRKLVGSAQRRRGGAFLQHGSVPLSPDPAAPGSTSLGELLGAAPDRESVVHAICAAMRHTLAPSLDSSQPTEAERALASELQAARYGAPAWTLER